MIIKILDEAAALVSRLEMGTDEYTLLQHTLRQSKFAYVLLCFWVIFFLKLPLYKTLWRCYTLHMFAVVHNNEFNLLTQKETLQHIITLLSAKENPTPNKMVI